MTSPHLRRRGHHHREPERRETIRREHHDLRDQAVLIRRTSGAIARHGSKDSLGSSKVARNLIRLGVVSSFSKVSRHLSPTPAAELQRVSCSDLWLSSPNSGPLRRLCRPQQPPRLRLWALASVRQGAPMLQGVGRGLPPVPMCASGHCANESLFVAGSALNPLGTTTAPPRNVVFVRAFLRVAGVDGQHLFRSFWERCCSG